MSSIHCNPIGGYFELELPERRTMPYEGLLKFQSARAAFIALLRAGNPKRVWMPRYICNAMIEPLMALGVEYLWYNINEHLAIVQDVRIGDEDWLLYVNYFGVCGKNIAELSRRFTPDRIVLDYSQSFFSPPNQKFLATLYSPRKFFGVPDGGLLYSNGLPVKLPVLRRLADSPESGYTDYLHAAESLSQY